MKDIKTKISRSRSHQALSNDDLIVEFGIGYSRERTGQRLRVRTGIRVTTQALDSSVARLRTAVLSARSQRGGGEQREIGPSLVRTSPGTSKRHGEPALLRAAGRLPALRQDGLRGAAGTRFAIRLYFWIINSQYIYTYI